MARAAFHTLGCKVNQYETQKIAESFLARGFELVDFSERADVYVINSCTVTHTADSKSRQAARNAWRRSPDALVVLTGCYAESSPETAGDVEGVSAVVGNQEKGRIVEHVMNRLAPALVKDLGSAGKPDLRTGRTRALVKVQDGCDRFCSYCVVPFARPVMSSRPLAEILAELESLAGRGFKEVVLTGIRLGCYFDENGTDLTGVVGAAAAVAGIERVRLSSIESTDVPAGLIELMSRNRRVCRHLHVPLQSGHVGILKRMNRPYTPGEYRAFVELVRSQVPGIAITTDIMVGFPGEGEEEFEATRRFMEEVRFARAHVFRYSARPRTAAARLPDEVPAAEKQRRSRILTDLAAVHSAQFAANLVGKTVPILLEGKSIRGKLWSGLTDNYVRVEVEADAHMAGEVVDVRVIGVSPGRVLGAMVTPACAA